MAGKSLPHRLRVMLPEAGAPFKIGKQKGQRSGRRFSNAQSLPSPVAEGYTWVAGAAELLARLYLEGIGRAKAGPDFQAGHHPGSPRAVFSSPGAMPISSRLELISSLA